MIYVTHDQTEALTFADQVVVMNEGEVVQIGTPVDLFERPAHTFVGHFIGSPGMNVLPCEVRGRRASSRATAASPAANHAPARRPQSRSASGRNSSAWRADGIPVEVQRVADIGRYRIVAARAAGQRINALLPGRHAGARAAAASRLRCRRRRRIYPRRLAGGEADR